MDYTRADVIRATMHSMLRDGTAQALTQGLPGNEAPGVEITEFRTDFAYAMYRIENKEVENAYVETAEFLKLDKVKLLGPENGSKYQIKVNPGETRDIVVRFGCNGFNIKRLTLTSLSKQTKLFTSNAWKTARDKREEPASHCTCFSTKQECLWCIRINLRARS